MYDKIGEKIKSLAIFQFVLGMTASIIYGLVYATADMENNTVRGLLIILIGSVCSWLGSLLVYGFGELIVRVTNIDERQTKSSSPSTSAEDKSETVTAYCPFCGNSFPMANKFCPHCGKINNHFN